MPIPKKMREAAELPVPQDVLEDLKLPPAYTNQCWEVHEINQLLDNDPVELRPLDYLAHVLHLLGCSRCRGIIPEVGLLWPLS